MKKNIVFFVFFCLSTLAYSQEIVWNGREELMNINKNIEFLEDKNGSLTFEEVSSEKFKTQFVQSQQAVLNFGFTESYHWLKFNLKNHTDQSLILEIAHAFLPVTEVYYYDQEGKIQKLSAGYKTSMEKKLIKNHFQAFPLPKGVNEFYVRLLSNSHPLPISIWRNDAFEIHSYKLKLTYGFYLGFMVFTIILSIFFAFSLRNWLHLLYAFMAFVYVCYGAMVMDGFIVYFFSDLDLMFLYVTIPTFGATLQNIYCLIFLEVKKYDPKLNKIIWGIVIYFFAYSLTRFFIPLVPVLAINTVNALISFFIMTYVGIKVGKKGNKMGYYFASAYAIYFALVLTEATYIQIGTPSYFGGLSHVALATLVEAFLLSFLLSKRFEWEKAEMQLAKEQAQRQVLTKTIENEKIVREQNIILEQKVQERTHELHLKNEEIQTQAEELQQQHEELKITNEQLEMQHDLLKLAHFDITSSITYAKRIQDTILPTSAELKKKLGEYFVFFRPRDVVSGDFYWLTEVQHKTIIPTSEGILSQKANNKVVFVLADCTGHGVPGAFMSLLGENLLDQIVNERQITNPNLILLNLNLAIRHQLKQDESENRDGMDIAICVIDRENQMLEFAAAKRPLIYFKNKELHEIKGDELSIGGSEVAQRKENKYNKYTISIDSPTIFYLFSDGYVDQFGGENNKKFMIKNFRPLLTKIHELPLSEQESILEETLKDWKGAQRQIDDVLVAGFRIN